MWGPQQPDLDSWGNGEDCVVFMARRTTRQENVGKWFDEDDDNQYSFICHRDTRKFKEGDRNKVLMSNKNEIFCSWKSELWYVWSVGGWM